MWFVESGSYPARPGNLVRPLVDGVPAFGRICEAVDAAEHSVWVTVCFLWDSFELPGGRGSLFDVLDRAAGRGVDVRLLCWRPDAPTDNTFDGSPAQVASLEARRSGVAVRWDRAYPGFAQHQKSWLIDGGRPSAVGFVGGMNLNPHTMATRDHHGEDQYHDVYLEVSGPSTVDIEHNFAQRWNGASERGLADGTWGPAGDLPSAAAPPPSAGETMVQIQRTIHAGRYDDLPAGERSIFDQYLLALGRARRTIYLENQFLEDAAIVSALHDALGRGVDVVALLPGEIDPGARRELTPERKAFLDARAALGSYPNFTLTGLAGIGDDGVRKHVYVHSKLMLVDDEWATVGSANLHGGGLYGSAELNAAFLDRRAVRELRCHLFAEYLSETTRELDDRAALRRFGEVARANRQRWDSGDLAWQGMAFGIDPATYGV